VSSELSNKGFAWGYVAGLIGVVLCVPWMFFLRELDGYRVAMLITGGWWIVFLWPIWKNLLVSAEAGAKWGMLFDCEGRRAFGWQRRR